MEEVYYVPGHSRASAEDQAKAKKLYEDNNSYQAINNSN
jgi:hypothetical protein